MAGHALRPTTGMTTGMTTDMTGAVRGARKAFPTGLAQPEGGYRFSLDPLLLAAFAPLKKNDRVVDLGAGCGVAGLAALLGGAAREIPAKVLSLDIDPAMSGFALANAVRLGLADSLRAQTLDIRHVRDELPAEAFTMALVNPPYRRQGTGIPCPDGGRERARGETRAVLWDFISAASWLLANRGRLAVVFAANRLSELLVACEKARLTPKRLRLVHSRLHEPARLLLLLAVKNGGSGMRVEAPLALYEGYGEATRLSVSSLAFCPFLA